MFDLAQLERAQAIVGAAMPPTPAHAWPLLSERLGAAAIVKHENHTPTGAFKVRGGLVYIDRLKRERPDTPGLISATRGNHGQSLAFAGNRHGVPVTIFVPRGNSVDQNHAMRAFGARLVEHGEDFQAAREEAYRRAAIDGLEFVPAFHPDLVLGVATYALSFAAGTVVTTATSNTFADGMATRIPDADALEIIRKGASRIVQVSDEEIGAAIRALWTDTHNLAEGAGAAALAAALQEKQKICGKRVGLVLSGGNIDLDMFRRWVMPEAVRGDGKVLV